jgi:exonuclease VII small subunit
LIACNVSESWIQSKRRLRSPAVVLGAFLVGLALALAGSAFAAMRAIGLWRQAKRTGRAFAHELSSFEERSAESERHLAEWERASQDLQLSLERLRRSRARLQVLQDALAQARSRVRWLRVFLPSS